MKITSLENIPLSEITRCFNEAFSDYFVKFNATEEYLRTRWTVARVNYALSFGAFENEKLIGFIMHGIGEKNGKKTAHNSATGIEPPYRGKKVLGKIYSAAIDTLKKNGIEQSTLEVISINEKAIKAYKKVGFNLNSELLHCFRGSPKTLQANTNIEIKKVERPDWLSYKTMRDYSPTWEMTEEALSVFPSEFEYREIYFKNQKAGYLIHSPKTGLVQQYAIHPKFRRNKLGTYLFSDLTKNMPQVRVNNVPKKDKASTAFLKKMGMENHIDQYEMALTFQ